jgi:hypothetical protein
MERPDSTTRESLLPTVDSQTVIWTLTLGFSLLGLLPLGFTDSGG